MPKFLSPALACATMGFLFSLGVVFACLGSLEYSQASAQNLQVRLGGGSATRTTIRPGVTITVRTNRPFEDLVVGNPDTADIVPLSAKSFYIQAKAIGVTNVSIYGEDKRLLGVIDVRVQQNSGDVRSAVRAAVPGATINVDTKGGQIRLTGRVANAVDRARAIAAAQQFSEKPVISALSVSDAQQVNLEVRVLEARRAIGRDLGVKIRASSGTSGLLGIGSGLQVNAGAGGVAQTFLQNADPASSRILSQNSPFGTLVANVLQSAGLRIDVIIDALEKKGLARRLAQPNITAISGEAAKFTAGGEVPIPSGSTDGVVTYEYRPYGVVLKFLPTVLDNSKINIRVESEVSEIDRTLAVNGNPAFTLRKAETVVELRDGQSFAMAGLLQVVNERDVEQLPWLGQIPVLGALFRSTSFQKQETDLVIVVTPRIVRPASPDEKIFSPLDNARSSNDSELFLLGLLEVDKDLLKKYREGEGIVGPYGHLIDLEFEDPYVAKK